MKNIMSEPNGICNTCFEAKLKREGDLFFVFCSCNKAGAIMLIEEGKPDMWSIVTPITELAFDTAVSIVRNHCLSKIEIKPDSLIH